MNRAPTQKWSDCGMPYDPEWHHRNSIRLAEYNYTQSGAYFITVCAYQRMPLFGEIRQGIMNPTEGGQLIEQCWNNLPNRFATIALDVFTLMPDHVHGILIIKRNSATALPSPSQVKLGEIVRAFKASSTFALHKHPGDIVGPIWQRNYYEHIIRTTIELDQTRQYILENPLRHWSRTHSSS